MENKSQALSTQELETIAGGIAEYKPVENPVGDLYNTVTDTILHKLGDIDVAGYGGDTTYYKTEKYTETKAVNGGSPN